MSNWKKARIAANVVTYNRKHLLSECIESLLNQTLPPDAIYIIDNASTDGTPEYLMQKGFINGVLQPGNDPSEDVKTIPIASSSDTSVTIHYVRMPKNTGSAGGQNAGMKMGLVDGFDWIWLMDDDTVPGPSALETLMKKVQWASHNGHAVGFACSKVLWTDGEVHLMNVPQVQPLQNLIPFNRFDNDGIIAVTAASFVSVLVNRLAIRDAGLPMKELFLWSDDTEYTGRITRKGYLGIYVKDSIVHHKTKDNYQVNIFTDTPGNAWKYFFGVRNKLYFIRKKNLAKFVSKFIAHFFFVPLKILARRKDARLRYIVIVWKASLASIVFPWRERLRDLAKKAAF